MTLIFSVFMVGFVLTTANALDPDQTITITNGPVADKPLLNLYIANGHSHTVTFLNHTGTSINVNNTSTPSGATDKDGALGNDVTNNNFVNYVFTCPGDAGNWVFTITQAGHDPITVTISVICTISVLTNWGILILMLLIVGTGIWVMSRKRLAHRGTSAY